MITSETCSRLDPSREQRADDGGAELGGRNLGERSAETADGRAQPPTITISLISVLSCECCVANRRRAGLLSGLDHQIFRFFILAM